MKMDYLVCLLIIIAIGKTTGSEDYKNQPLDNSPGLYFEKIHNVKFKRAEWRMVLFVDVKRLDTEFPERLKDCEKIVTECKNLNMTRCTTPMLDSLIEQAERERQEMMEFVAEITLPTYEIIPKSMAKRDAPFAFVGSASHSLFGILTTEDAKYFNSEIDKLYQDQQKLTKILRGFVHLITSDLHKIHDITDEHHRKIEQNRNAISEIINRTNSLTTRVDEMDYNHELLSYRIDFEEYLEHYIDSVNKFLEVIQKARDGKVDERLLTSAQMKEMIRELHEIAGEYEIPIPHLHRKSEELGKIATTEVSYYEGKILIVISLPLAERTQYHLYQIHTWPISQRISNATVSAQIIPQSKYIGLSDNHQVYFFADDKYLQECINTRHGHLCTTQLPVYEVATSNACELNLLLNPDAGALRQCDIRMHARHQPFWTRLNSIGAWLYSLSEPETLQILCKNSKVQLITIKGTGMLYLNGDCMGKTNYVTLLGVKVFMQKEQYLYQPNLSLNFTQIAPKLDHQNLIQIVNTGPIREHAEFRLGKSLYEVEQQLEDLGQHHRENQQQTYLTSGGYFSQVCIILAIILFCCRNKIKAKLCPKKGKQNVGKIKINDFELTEIISKAKEPSASKQVKRPSPTLPPQVARCD